MESSRALRRVDRCAARPPATFAAWIARAVWLASAGCVGGADRASDGGTDAHADAARGGDGALLARADARRTDAARDDVSLSTPGDAALSTPGPCASHGDCASCAAAPGCGWCGASGACVDGESSGPSGGATCSAGWAYLPSACATTGWTEIPNPSPGYLTDVWGSGPGDVYVGGVGGIYHAHGDGIFRREFEADLALSLWGSGPHDVYAVVQTVGSNYRILHSSGDGAWSEQFTTRFDVRVDELDAVGGSGPNDVYVVGRYQGLTAHHGMVLHSGGDGRWSVQRLDHDDVMSAVWAASPHDVYLMGFESRGDPSTIWFSNDGARWSEEMLGGPPNYRGRIGGSGVGDVYAGAQGGVLHTTGDGVWQLQSVPGDTLRIVGVWAVSADDVWAVGSDMEGTSGTDDYYFSEVVLHSSGDGTWQRSYVRGAPADQTIGIVQPAVWGSGPDDVYVVGPGSILHHP